MSFFRSSKSRLLSIIVLALILALLASMVSFTNEPIEVYAETVDYWQLKVGDEAVAILAAEGDADKIIEKVRDNYVGQDENVVDVKMSPAITAEKITVLKDDVQPNVEANLDKVVESLIAGEVIETTYVVQEGDTPWDISLAVDMSVEELYEMNPQQDFETLYAGDEIKISEEEPDQLLNVIVEYQEEKEEAVPFETVYVEDPEMYEDEEEYIETTGQEGKRKVTTKTLKVNGVVKEVKEIDSEELEAPVSQVVVYGTLERPVEETVEETYEDYSDYSDESYGNYSETFNSSSETVSTASTETSSSSYSAATYSGNGQAIVDYALQFVGNPYVWGGTSLTNGCDCSGFVYRVFNDCGYSIARWPDSDYPHVSASELQPGDICRYGGHYAIYIGNGMEISAVNEAEGIRTHPMYYSRSSFMYGIRVIG